jgi:hypothetical protein
VTTRPGPGAGLHNAILAADGGTTIGIGPRAALYGGVSVCLLASAILPSGKMSRRARSARLATSAAAMGLVFMGAIVVPVYLVPALTLTLALGLAAESRPARRSSPRAGTRNTSPSPPADGTVLYHRAGQVHRISRTATAPAGCAGITLR